MWPLNKKDFDTLALYSIIFISKGPSLYQASPYPLILSLENHCSIEQQTVMARQLRSILGDKLLTKPLNGLDSHSLPSPEVSGQCHIIFKKEKARLKTHTT